MLTVKKNNNTPIYANYDNNNKYRTDNSTEDINYFNRAIIYVAIGMKNDFNGFIEGIDISWS